MQSHHRVVVSCTDTGTNHDWTNVPLCSLTNPGNPTNKTLHGCDELVVEDRGHAGIAARVAATAKSCVGVTAPVPAQMAAVRSGSD